ncbi:MAG: hypothetical protein RI900_3270 [Actinomycetota bacterium]
MTERILPDDVANGLVDGTAPAGSAPSAFHGAAELLGSMRAPATPGELEGLSAFMQQFAATVTTTEPAPAAATRTGVVQMFTTRITKRAAVVVAATLLTAGTAAAAASGVIPTPFVAATDDSTSTSLSLPDSSLDDSAGGSVTSTSVDDSATSSSVDDSATSSSVDDSGAFPHDAHDQCEAIQKGMASDADKAAVADQAAVMGVSVAEYCVLADAAHEAGDDHGSSGHGADDAAGDDHGSGGHGADDAPGTSTPSSGTVDDSGKNRGGKGSSSPVTTAPSHSTPVVTAPSNSTPVTTPSAGTTDDSGSGKGGKGKGGKGSDDASNG